MKQNRQSKIVAIVALCISVLGLTLGFAAFSNTLTISSSATVSPDEADFKITVLGLNQDAFKDGDSIGDVIFDLNNYNQTSSYPKVNYDRVTATPAVIDNENLTLKNLSASLIKDDDSAVYYFVLRNDGEYDAYFDVASLSDLYEGKTGTCTPDAGTSADLVNQTCSSIKLQMMLASDDGEIDMSTIDKYEIKKGDYIYLVVGVSYDSATVYADGDFSVSFEDLKLEFSTTK